MPNSKDKKDDILQASLELFGEYGLNGTSIRMIAKQAKVNIAAIAYYFCSKENLYLEVAKHISQQIGGYIEDSKLTVHGSVNMDNLSKDEALLITQGIFRKMAEMFFQSEKPKAWSRIIMREQARPTKAFDIIYQSVMKPMQDMLSESVAIYLEKPPTSDEVKIRIHALMGEVLAFLTSRESLLRHLGVEKLTMKHTHLIYNILDNNIAGALGRKL